MSHVCYGQELKSSHFICPPVKETVETEDLDERDEDDGGEAVPMESESYVALRKRMVTKHNLKIDNLLQENGRLCREFKRKQVKRLPVQACL